MSQTADQAVMIPGDVFGLDLSHTDGTNAKEPQLTRLEPDAYEEWFKARPEESTAALRIFCVRLHSDFSCSPSAIAQLLKSPLLSNIVDHAIWGSHVYHSLIENAGGGAVALLDQPCRFILRTPNDGGPFCSFAASKHRGIAKAIYLYNDDAFDLTRSTGGKQCVSGWRSSGLQVVTPAHMFVHAQATHFTTPGLAAVIDAVKCIEAVLETATDLPRNSPTLNRTLHNCSRRLVDIERRSRFETIALDAIESLAVHLEWKNPYPWPITQPARMAVAARTYDFDSLPRRIENARATISALLQQRNEQLNLELAHSSERIAEATFADSKSMKTIAILTMVFLPGTAVASLFSMSMFDWSSEGGGGIASRWLWIYFVVTIPLTGVVLGVWWLWGQRVEQAARRVYAQREAQRARRFVDEEQGPSLFGTVENDEIELQTGLKSSAKAGED